MKKLILFVSILIISHTVEAQDSKDSEENPKAWAKKGEFKLLFNQYAFSNWLAGGENNIAGNVNFKYDFNYLKDNLTWNNRVEMSYGLTKSKNDEFVKKTDDRFEFNSTFGLKAHKNWYYSILFNFKTQLSKGYIFDVVDDVEIRTEHSNIFSPAYFLLGPGMLWEKSKYLRINISPATTKLIIVDEKYTYLFDEYFGVEEGKSSRWEFGFRVSGYYKFILMENVTMENTFAFYSNYLDEPENIDIDYKMSIDMKINKILSANLNFQTIYDDNSFEGFQIKEVFGLGLSFEF